MWAWAEAWLIMSGLQSAGIALSKPAGWKVSSCVSSNALVLSSINWPTVHQRFLQNNFIAINLTPSNQLHSNFENIKEEKETRGDWGVMKLECHRCVGVTDLIMQQVNFPLEPGEPWNVLQCIFPAALHVMVLSPVMVCSNQQVQQICTVISNCGVLLCEMAPDSIKVTPSVTKVSWTIVGVCWTRLTQTILSSTPPVEGLRSELWWMCCLNSIWAGLWLYPFYFPSHRLAFYLHK